MKNLLFVVLVIVILVGGYANAHATDKGIKIARGTSEIFDAKRPILITNEGTSCTTIFSECECVMEFQVMGFDKSKPINIKKGTYFLIPGSHKVKCNSDGSLQIDY
jgi:hypothetical protein